MCVIARGNRIIVILFSSRIDREKKKKLFSRLFIRKLIELFMYVMIVGLR